MQIIQLFKFDLAVRVRSSVIDFLTITFLSILLLASGSTLWAADLNVHLDNPPSTGTVVLVMFDSANTFGDFRDPARVVKHRLDGRKNLSIQDVPPGEYALLVYYDENNNDRLDRNFIGIPKEPLGFSNRYRPKGPPSYKRAAFVLREDESHHFDVQLRRPLGKRGRLGAGLGVIAQTSPYRGYDGGVYQAIPAITYTSERFQVYGPNIQIGLAGSGKLRLAATGNYRIGAYEEDGSDFLSGMGDRKDTFMTGLAVNAELPGGLGISTGYAHDLIGKIGGGEAHVKFDRSFQIGTFRFSPQIGLNWLSSELANYDFGVPSSKATPDRTAYSLDSVISVEGGIGISIEITQDWLVVLNTSVEYLDRDVTESPIVSEDHLIKGLAFINYVF